MRIRCWYNLDRDNRWKFHTRSCYIEQVASVDTEPLWEIQGQDQQSVYNLWNGLFEKGGFLIKRSTSPPVN